ncbi:DUF664 domain-containing protein [Kribbella sp. NPDC051587]|uniref:mycothiol transferase n=1 Tax=Kribbella sp. NPDC051587 TaxID=3364119 RepID=UPI003792DF76
MQWKDIPMTECLRGGEAEMLQFAVNRVRRQFAWKTGNLTASQLRQQHPPSTMTLAGLVKHLAFVEAGFTARAAQRPIEAPWDVRDWVANDNWAWESAVTDDPQELYQLWYSSVERSQATWAELCADDGLDVLIDEGNPDWITSRRRILVDMLEEYLKHTGHADVLREAVDGLRGNDPE